jgi:hypothetical protein
VSANGIVWPKSISYALYSVHIERYLVFTSSFVDLQLDLNDHLYHACIACYEFVILHYEKVKIEFSLDYKKKTSIFERKSPSTPSVNGLLNWISFKIKKENLHDICRGNRQL